MTNDETTLQKKMCRTQTAPGQEPLKDIPSIETLCAQFNQDVGQAWGFEHFLYHHLRNRSVLELANAHALFQ